MNEIELRQHLAEIAAQPAHHDNTLALAVLAVLQRLIRIEAKVEAIKRDLAHRPR